MDTKKRGKRGNYRSGLDTINNQRKILIDIGRRDFNSKKFKGVKSPQDMYKIYNDYGVTKLKKGAKYGSKNANDYIFNDNSQYGSISNMIEVMDEVNGGTKGAKTSFQVATRVRERIHLGNQVTKLTDRKTGKVEHIYDARKEYVKNPDNRTFKLDKNGRRIVRRMKGAPKNFVQITRTATKAEHYYKGMKKLVDEWNQAQENIANGKETLDDLQAQVVSDEMISVVERYDNGEMSHEDFAEWVDKNEDEIKRTLDGSP